MLIGKACDMFEDGVDDLDNECFGAEFVYLLRETIRFGDYLILTEKSLLRSNYIILQIE
jgi:hypothetical protein